MKKPKRLLCMASFLRKEFDCMHSNNIVGGIDALVEVLEWPNFLGRTLLGAALGFVYSHTRAGETVTRERGASFRV